MELTLVLTDDSGSYQSVLGQFIETAVADTLNDRILAQSAADSAASSASDSSASASQASTYATSASGFSNASSNSATAAAGSASSAANSQTTAANNASNAAVSASNASASATTANTAASSASGSASAAASSATSASNSASSASTTLANALVKTNNLSDVSSPSTALTNIGGASLSQVQTLSQEYTVFFPTATSQTLTSSVLGGVVYWYSASTGTITLQQVSSAFQGAKLKIVNGNTGNITISAFSGDTISITGTTFSSITLGPGDDLDLVRADTAIRWDCVGGSARASITPLRVATGTLSAHAVNLAQLQSAYTSFGYGYLSYTSTTLLTLTRKNGTTIPINGKSCIIPSAGITCSSTGTASATVYNIYAVSSDGVNVTSLEYSTTAYVFDATYGIASKSGDATRSLVGQQYVLTAGQWYSSATYISTISYYQRGAKVISNVNATGTSSTAISFLSCYALSWNDEILSAKATVVGLTASVTNARVYLRLNSTNINQGAVNTISSNNYQANFSQSSDVPGVANSLNLIDVYGSNDANVSFTVYSSMTLSTRG